MTAKDSLAKYPATIKLKKVGEIEDFDKKQVDKDGWTKCRLFGKGKATYVIKRWNKKGNYTLQKKFPKQNEFSWIPLGHLIDKVGWFKHLMKGGRITVDEDILIKA